MLKFVRNDVVFQEVPDEVTLAVNISNCPHRCNGCHSQWLWEDKGEILDSMSIDILLENYLRTITCFCFMGGDADITSLYQLAAYIRKRYPSLKIAWYSGTQNIPDDFPADKFDYVKFGPYIAELGALKSPETNQRFYVIKDGKLIDRTSLFWKGTKK